MIQLEGNALADIESAKLQLKQKLQLIKELDDAMTPLMQTHATHLKYINSALAMNEQYNDLDKRSQKVESLDRVHALDNEASVLFSKLEPLGVLFDSDVQSSVDGLNTKEPRVRYAGYGLTILSLIVAGIAQLLK
jgi:hypothetical protein